jgi:hypothetical protein
VTRKPWRKVSRQRRIRCSGHFKFSFFEKVPPCTLAGFDLKTFSSVLLGVRWIQYIPCRQCKNICLTFLF